MLLVKPWTRKRHEHVFKTVANVHEITEYLMRADICAVWIQRIF